LHTTKNTASVYFACKIGDPTAQPMWYQINYQHVFNLTKASAAYLVYVYGLSSKLFNKVIGFRA